MPRTPIYIICSPRPQVGKTLVARLLGEFLLLQRGDVVAFDVILKEPLLLDFLPHHTETAEVDDTFSKMKPTLVYALFGGLLLGGLAFGKALLGYVFDQAFQLDEEGWRKLTFRWGLFFLGCAVLNEIVWRTLGHIYPPDLADKYWAGFKLFGFTALTFLFMLTQMPLIARHSPEENSEE